MSRMKVPTFGQSFACCSLRQNKDPKVDDPILSGALMIGIWCLLQGFLLDLINCHIGLHGVAIFALRLSTLHITSLEYSIIKFKRTGH